MPNEIRTVCYDTDLQIEAYRFEGIMQKFPNHFHDYYVIGFIEEGQRYLQCNHQDYIIHPGDILIFNPRDIHSCEQIDEKVLDYRCINIQPDRMRQVVLEITGRDYLPDFTHNVICRSELASSLQELHHMICEGETDFVKEELFFFLIGQLMQDYSDTSAEGTAQERDSEFQAVCDYMETNYFQKITLDELSGMVGLSKYHFLRSFTRQRGISPYNYLETIRIGKAKKLLEQGIAPVDAAHQTGFSDQSHFTNFFKRFIGLTPRQYMRIFLHANPVERSAPKEDI
ncbi:AraC family transcriptional regulator [Paenibacillus elgii]|uniref:AraC family transcriptional regulator n=1 Tax=Paenibacillus elgii TaxID=189691 RepID=UPI002D7A5C4F|nr:AraC family transcriptional regulator [Paenibacillus elgii]